MRLGNSKGNNTGKKYVMRGKHDKQATRQGTEKALKFSQWFTKTYTSLVCELKGKLIFDDDVLGDTFLRIYENMLYTGIELQNNRSYFMRSYFTNYIQNNMKSNRYCQLPVYYDAADTGEYNLELEMHQRQLEEDIFSYVYERYDVREFELFKMYVSLKPAINYYVLADMTNMKAHQIQSIVSKIKKDIRHNIVFINRRKELV